MPSTGRRGCTVCDYLAGMTDRYAIKSTAGSLTWRSAPDAPSYFFFNPCQR